ncbi:hypothetical protein BOTBODRAFT_192396 [Botryobasidium botryosum FD-172 SS1]|uniref:Cytochrome c oxidase subunit 8, mitochondrial n=1 Tax=Botryobasidium botryosum (strain FD-172 SS1) TaxID=930990 RepID=A0A067LYL9_BOTB1|nr:hypothetical protein BOTBODRAFT_192396 [Botryobasidium botryosum FD-172 SS1]
MLQVARSAALRSARMRPLVQTRGMHVDNVVGNNMPFKYQGVSKAAFAAKVFLFLGGGFSIPFAASYYQLSKQ